MGELGDHQHQTRRGSIPLRCPRPAGPLSAASLSPCSNFLPPSQGCDYFYFFFPFLLYFFPFKGRYGVPGLLEWLQSRGSRPRSRSISFISAQAVQVPERCSKVLMKGRKGAGEIKEAAKPLRDQRKGERELSGGIGTDAPGSAGVWFASVSGCVLTARKFTFLLCYCWCTGWFQKVQLHPSFCRLPRSAAVPRCRGENSSIDMASSHHKSTSGFLMVTQ